MNNPPFTLKCEVTELQLERDTNVNPSGGSSPCYKLATKTGHGSKHIAATYWMSTSPTWDKLSDISLLNIRHVHAIYTWQPISIMFTMFSDFVFSPLSPIIIFREDLGTQRETGGGNIHWIKWSSRWLAMSDICNLHQLFLMGWCVFIYTGMWCVIWWGFWLPPSVLERPPSGKITEAKAQIAASQFIAIYASAPLIPEIFITRYAGIFGMLLVPVLKEVPTLVKTTIKCVSVVFNLYMSGSFM